MDWKPESSDRAVATPHSHLNAESTSFEDEEEEESGFVPFSKRQKVSETSPTTTSTTTPSSQQETDFERYYRIQRILPNEIEWKSFIHSCQQPLPITFRINKLLSSSQKEEYHRQLSAFFSQYSSQLDSNNNNNQLGIYIDWCDGYQLNVSQYTLKYEFSVSIRFL